jgi:hypothetical protein
MEEREVPLSKTLVLPPESSTMHLVSLSGLILEDAKYVVATFKLLNNAILRADMCLN